MWIQIGPEKRAPGNHSQAYYEGSNGEVCEDLQQALEFEMASKHVGGDVSETKVHLSVLQQFLNECCSEKEQRQDGEQRYVLTTSALEDWLHRGSHPILASMSLQVYAM